MVRLIRSIATMAGGFLLAASPAATQGTKDIASCKAVLDANIKSNKTPTHMYMQEVTGRSSAPSTSELVRVGGTTYVQVGGKWRRSPIKPEEMEAQEKENLENAKALVCHRAGEESVNGVPASIFTEHSETEFASSDGKIWVANGTGLIVRQELDMSMGGADGKTHRSIRYDYTNVQPPIGTP